MLSLRKQLIIEHRGIPLTTEESQIGKHTLQNPTWLMEHRGNLAHTHPHFKGPFTAHVYPYHIYFSFEEWRKSGANPNIHWDSPYVNSVKSYNPKIPSYGRCEMMLPFKQRQARWKLNTLEPEIFDALWLTFNDKLGLLYPFFKKTHAESPY